MHTKVLRNILRLFLQNFTISSGIHFKIPSFLINLEFLKNYTHIAPPVSEEVIPYGDKFVFENCLVALRIAW